MEAASAPPNSSGATIPSSPTSSPWSKPNANGARASDRRPDRLTRFDCYGPCADYFGGIEVDDAVLDAVRRGGTVRMVAKRCRNERCRHVGPHVVHTFALVEREGAVVLDVTTARHERLEDPRRDPQLHQAKGVNLYGNDG